MNQWNVSKAIYFPAHHLPMCCVRLQFVCIAQQDYCCILNQVEKNMQKVEEEGEIVMVKEHRELDRTGTRKGHIVIKVNRTPQTSASQTFS